MRVKDESNAPLNIYRFISYGEGPHRHILSSFDVCWNTYVSRSSVHFHVSLMLMTQYAISKQEFMSNQTSGTSISMPVLEFLLTPWQKSVRYWVVMMSAEYICGVKSEVSEWLAPFSWHRQQHQMALWKRSDAPFEWRNRLTTHFERGRTCANRNDFRIYSENQEYQRLPSNQLIPLILQTKSIKKTFCYRLPPPLDTVEHCD